MSVELMRQVARAFYLADDGSREEQLLEQVLEVLCEKEGISGTEVVAQVTQVDRPITVHGMAEIVEELLGADSRLDAAVKASKVRGDKKGYGKNFEVVVVIDVKEGV